MSRDAGEVFVFAGVNYYDGQGFLVRRSLSLNSATELNGARVCVQAGSTAQANADDFFRSRGSRTGLSSAPRRRRRATPMAARTATP
ncbi:hypothetical protein [Brevundimonas aurantiaca]|uniref:hypothetical protein n=1 Tax=Brevundimonas aurantiaca TaxID=74316 RepID=UPI001CD485E9|nr:hypothetical protein [Brevundimonas aurantiaca]